MKNVSHGIVEENNFGSQKKIKLIFMLKLEFNHTSIQARKNKKAILKKISKVIDSGIFLNGSEDKRLISKFNNFFSSKYFLTTASGHDSLLLALKYFNLKPTDEVIFPVNSYPTAFPVFLSGAKGIPSDVDENGQIDPDKILKRTTPKTKVIVVVHLYGLVGQLDKIVKICKDKKIFLIEDCAQAFGTKYKNKYVGTFGQIGCFSFFPTKNLGTLGDGGGILTKDKKIYDYFIKAKSYGESKRFKSEFVSGHSRIPEIQSAVLNLYLNEFTKEASERKKAYFDFKAILENKNLQKYLRVLKSSNESTPVPHLFVIAAKKRDQLVKFLTEKGLPVIVRYPYPVSKVPAFSFLKKSTYRNAEKLSKEIVCLPFHHFLKKKDMVYIANVISKFYNS